MRMKWTRANWRRRSGLWRCSIAWSRRRRPLGSCVVFIHMSYTTTGILWMFDLNTRRAALHAAFSPRGRRRGRRSRGRGTSGGCSTCRLLSGWRPRHTCQHARLSPVACGGSLAGGWPSRSVEAARQFGPPSSTSSRQMELCITLRRRSCVFCNAGRAIDKIGGAPSCARRSVGLLSVLMSHYFEEPPRLR